MPVIREGLFTICKRFPDHKNEVKRLFRKSENFKAMCGDHLRCVEALRYWNQSNSEEAPARREEYTALLEALEAEILQILDESQ